MTPADIDRVFGRSRLRMVTGAHVEVFREASLPGERRRYTKRFLATAAGDFRMWTEREWRILARLVGHGIGPVPDVVQFDRGASDRPALVQTYDAGITVDHWATLLPVERDGSTRHHVFADCAHWWALARHCLIALDAIHQLQLVHLDLKADNVCIPAGPADFDPHAPDARLHLRFEQIALIDFAFSLVSGERLDSALPIARQTEYDYQSPRLLQALEAGAAGDLGPTRALDWRCDIFSLAAMLRRYLPDPERAADGLWTQSRLVQARALVRRLLDVHDAELPVVRPHAELITLASTPLQDDDLAASLAQGWTLATAQPVPRTEWPTPVTRIAMPVATLATPIVTGVDVEPITIDPSDVANRSCPVAGPARRPRRVAWAAAVLVLAAVSVPLLGHEWSAWRERDASGAVDDARGKSSAPTTVAMARGSADLPRRAADAGAVSADADLVRRAAGAASAPSGPSASAPSVASVASPSPSRSESPVPPASSRSVETPVAKTPPSAPVPARPAEVPAPAPAAAQSEPRDSKAAHAPDSASTLPTRSSPATTKPANGAATPLMTARAGKAATKDTLRAPAGAGAGKPVVTASNKSRTSTTERNGVREPARAPTRVASNDRPKTRTAAAPARDGALEPRPGWVASLGAKGDAALKPAASSAAHPAVVPAPEPWPHTAMASGMASAKSRTDARGIAPAAPPAPAPSANERALMASAAPSMNAAAVGTAPMRTAPAVALPSVAAPVANGSTIAPPGGFAPEPTDPNGPPPSTPFERSRSAAIPSAALSSVNAPLSESRAAVSTDFAARAGDLMANQLPRLAQRAERSVMKVLFTAARSDADATDDEIRQAASTMRRAPDETFADLPLAAGDARQLNDAARAAFYRRGSAREAADLQLRAFGANPTDAEVVGNLAFLRLKQQPAQPEPARQLALHALTLPDARFPHGRLEDWTTFAIASALSGRERDARHAWWVSAALAPNRQRQCRAAMDAYALYGERLRPSVESMLQRLHASGRADGTAFCSWPPYWTVGSSR